MNNINNRTEPVVVQQASAIEILGYLKTVIACSAGILHCKENFYCGITNDVESNLSRHKVNGYVACVQCPTAGIAAKVEKMMQDEGYDIGDVNYGGNGGAADSDIVYVCYKEDGFEK